MRRGWVIDLEKCIGCRSCAVACKQHNAQPPGNWWATVETPGSKYHLTMPEQGRGYFLPVTCQHCKNAPCVKVCPVEATYKDKDGMVLIDFERCIGCRYCMSACPYGVRQFNWEDPKKTLGKLEYVENYSYGYPLNHRKEHNGFNRLVYMKTRFKGVVEKCVFCVHYYDTGGLDPACVRGCPGQARFVGDLDDPDSKVSQLIRDNEAFTLLPEKGTEPSCFYLPPSRKKKHLTEV